MSRRFAIALAVVFSGALGVPLVAPLVAQAADYKLGAITVRQPWSRPAQAGMNGVGFMTVANAGKAPVTLLRMEAAAAQAVEIHQSAMVEGVMTMRELDKGVTVPAGGQVAFAPGGLHFMILNLKAEQKVGQKVPVTLVFDKGRRLKVDLTVRRVPPPVAQTAPPEAHRH